MDIDPYLILSVARDSGPAEWKRAYRRLAMRWHPDRNDDPQATERFKEIGTAYELLMAADAAEVVDEPVPDTAPAEAEPETPRAPDIRLNLEISLEEGATGCCKPVRYARGKPCVTCSGSGEAGVSRTRFCDACHGSGRVHDAGRHLVRCTACDGRGLFTERICPDCRGSGQDADELNLEITVPPGMLPGDELRVGGQGQPGDETRQPGDLYLTIVFHSHPLYRLQGRDVHYAMPVSALALIAGGDVELPTPLGICQHELESASVERRTIRLPGKGYPGRGKYPAGDLVVELEPVFPDRLSARQRSLLRQVHASLMEDAVVAMPEIAAWQSAHLSA